MKVVILAFVALSGLANAARPSSDPQLPRHDDGVLPPKFEETPEQKERARIHMERTRNEEQQRRDRWRGLVDEHCARPGTPPSSPLCRLRALDKEDAEVIKISTIISLCMRPKR